MIKVKLLSYTPEPEKTVAAAAKLCYSSSDIESLLDNLTQEKAAEFVQRLADLGHQSPIEHASFTFGIEGVSRALLAQITRLRIASYSVQSQRYVTKGSFEYIVPPEIEAIPEAKEEYLRAMEASQKHYDTLTQILKQSHVTRLTQQGVDEKTANNQAQKLAIEDARFVLPNACDTKMVVTMNARSLYNFFAHRCCNRAQWEIRELADLMLVEVCKVAPTLFAKAGAPCVSGGCPEGKMSCGKMAEVREHYKTIKGENK